MHRFYLPPEKCHGDVLGLDGREAHHARHVLRLKQGEAATVLDGAGHEFRCQVENVGKNSLALVVKEKKPAPAPPALISLFVAVPKGKIIESIIQKAVELGTHRIVPLLTERVVTHLDDEGAEHKRDKWQQVAIEAIKQCGARWLPEITTPATLAGALNPTRDPGSSPSAFELSLVGSLQTDRRHPREVIREFQSRHGRLPQRIAVWIGPEGDFSPDELKAIESSGAQPITLGNLTLRVETAAIYSLSILNYELSSSR